MSKRTSETAHPNTRTVLSQQTARVHDVLKDDRSKRKGRGGIRRFGVHRYRTAPGNSS